MTDLRPIHDPSMLVFDEGRPGAYGHAAVTPDHLRIAGHGPIELELSGYYSVDEARALLDWLKLCLDGKEGTT